MSSCRIRIRAVPNAKKTEITEMFGDAVKVRIQAVPEDGRANKELIMYFAKILDLPKKNVSLVSGESSRDKVLEIEAYTFEDVFAKIRPLLKKI